MKLLLLLVLPAMAMGLGAPAKVEELNAKQQGIVDFAFSQLTGGDFSCPKKIVKIENFSQQVVSGILYKFDLVLGNHEDNAASCSVNNPDGKSCTVVVWEKPWENFKEVQWDKVTCDLQSTTAKPKLLRVSLTASKTDGSVSQVLSKAVNSAETVEHSGEVLGGGDHDYVPHGKKMIGIGDHDYVPHGKKMIGSGDHDYVPHGKKMIGSGAHDYVPHGKKMIGSGDHDYVPHGKKMIGSGDHDYVPHGKKMIGSGDHDYVPHGKKMIGSGDHDYIPHGKKMIGSGDHDYVPHGKKLLGGGDHDYVPHGLVGGGEPHGPRFRDTGDVLNQAKKLSDIKTSVKKLKEMQSLDNFHSFMATHNKVYSSRQEYKKRYRIFRDNMKKVQFLQETELGTGEYGASSLADLTEQEFKQNYLGINMQKDDPDIHWPPADIPDVELPTEWDWRTKNAVTPVKNQGQCGSCWAFSVTGNVEGLYAIKNQKLVSLSEQELVDCDTRDSGCNGGLPENAYKTLLEIGGLESEEEYGYDGEDEKCKFNRTRAIARVSGGVEISQNETQMAQWLLTNGPISVGLNANAMQFYMGGVSHPWKFLCGADGIDHGVLIVGFGVHEYPLFHKTMPFWTIKNSWGPSWGEQGYYRLYRGDGTCGINMMTSSAVLAETDAIEE